MLRRKHSLLLEVHSHFTQELHSDWALMANHLHPSMARGYFSTRCVGWVRDALTAVHRTGTSTSLSTVYRISASDSPMIADKKEPPCTGEKWSSVWQWLLTSCKNIDSAFSNSAPNLCKWELRLPSCFLTLYCLIVLCILIGWFHLWFSNWLPFKLKLIPLTGCFHSFCYAERLNRAHYPFPAEI